MLPTHLQFAFLPSLNANCAVVPPGRSGSSNDLVSAELELRRICNRLPPHAATTLYQQQAIRAALWANLPEATIGHCSCYRTFNLDDPRATALQLAEGDQLTLRDLVTGDAKR